ncbi:glycosyltransferase family 4 protein [Vibrio sp. 431]|uniref:glycosyltransferase family 4 protein n=1 Tax=Vibrio TaxID=662 RepID=UPI0029642143|nr:MULTISPECIES: glycosyltransferase family 4 protein [unclassified Vibrio]MDW1964774.1 glycosyltransferase family 4 protein [Vibrio sp. Vb0587]MDW2006635.1 glycosyltransferase family 4 protein [Vibrio sp. 431]
MKILQITTVAATLDAFLIPYAIAFKEQGWVVDAAAKDIFEYDKVVSEHNECFDVEFCRSIKNPMSIIKSFFQVRKLLKSKRYDVVHVHTPIAAFLTRLSSLGVSKTRVYYTAHGFHFINTNPLWKNFIFYLLEKVAGYKTNHLFVINHDDYKFALEKKIVPEKSISLVNGIGVDIDKYQFDDRGRDRVRGELKLSRDTFMFLHVAEINENKNHGVVIQALSKFKENASCQNFVYVIAGNGSLKNKIEQKVFDLGLEDHVIFLGHRKDIKEIMSASDALILSSRREGLPRCILEAMCAKRPIIASNIRGCTDLLSNGSGILVKHDEWKQWLNAIDSLYNNPKLCVEMGRLGFEFVESDYNQEQVINSVLKVYYGEVEVC